MRSKYYDPVKAHEYYEKHKKLKGRRSTTGFSESQKERWAYAKHVLGEEKKERNTSDRERINAAKSANIAAIEAAKKQQREQLTSAAQGQISRLRDELKGMSKDQKASAKARIQEAISKIRDVLKGDKSSLNESAKEKKSAIREDAKQQKTDARAKSQEKYESDLDSAYDEIKKKKK